MNLLSLQKTFRELIHDRSFPGSTGESRKVLLDSLVKPGNDMINLTPDERFSIYKNAYEMRLIESLGEDFPQVKKILSADVFWNLGKEYLKFYPSRYWSVGEVSKNFPKFIANANLQYEYLADLAQFEWLKIIACFAEDAKLFDFSSIAGIDADKQQNIVLKLNSSVCLFKSSWALHLDNISQHDSLYLVYQKQGEALHVLLTPLQWDILEKISQGFSIGEIFSTFQDIREEEITNWFSVWVSEKIISHFELNCSL